jgi:tetraacyldisaccharide 4'-kinase
VNHPVLYRWIQALWYGRWQKWAWLFAPLAWLYRVVMWLRRKAYLLGIFRQEKLPVPVIVVGNMTVGGTGKSPMVAALVAHLRHLGRRPGVVSRGYGGAASFVHEVFSDSDPEVVGDEALMLKRALDCPVAVGRHRVKVGRFLLENADCDVLVCDDGLQHLALERDINVVMVDGLRGLGNGFCLPAGPLREPWAAKPAGALCVYTGGSQNAMYRLHLQAVRLLPLKGGAPMRLADLMGRRVLAVAGIGHPERFFQTLRQLGARLVERALPDHHVFTSADLQTEQAVDCVVITAKDAVKCERFAASEVYVLEVGACLPEPFWQAFDQQLETV